AAQKIASELDSTNCANEIAQWIGVFVDSGRAELRELLTNYDDSYGRGRYDNRGRFESNLGYITGIAYLARLFPTPVVLSRLCDLAEAVSRWQHDHREESFMVASAAVRALGMIDTDDAVAALSRCEMRVRWPKLRKLITKTLDEAIKQRGGS